MSALCAEILLDGRAETSYDGYFGNTTVGATLDDFFGMNLLVHRWDIARGSGLVAHEPLDDTDAVRYPRAARGSEDALRMDGVCGPEVVAPPGASAGVHLIAFLGRPPDWTAHQTGQPVQ
ncbi:MAG: hypothetical protein L0H93_11920 [Nocardioides sp.]|nr:hypothetical protein [Nocardioides sp.]